MDQTSITLTGVAGILGCGLLFPGVVLVEGAGDVQEGFYNPEDTATILADLADSRTALLAGSWLQFAAIMVLMFFGVGLALILRPQGSLPYFGLAGFVAGAAISATGWLLVLAFAWDLSSVGNEPASGILRAGFIADWVGTGAFLTVGVGLYSAVGRRATWMPTWLSAAGVLIALVWLVHMLAMGVDGFNDATSIAAPAGVLWMITTSIVILTHRNALAATVAPVPLTPTATN